MIETGMLAEVVLHPHFISTSSFESVFEEIVHTMNVMGGRSFRLMCHKGFSEQLLSACKRHRIDCITRMALGRHKDIFNWYRLIPMAMTYPPREA